MCLTVRDERLRATFADLRQRGLTVEAAVEQLRGPYADEHGRAYFLSDERVRAVVYRKGARPAPPDAAMKGDAP